MFLEPALPKRSVISVKFSIPKTRIQKVRTKLRTAQVTSTPMSVISVIFSNVKLRKSVKFYRKKNTGQTCNDSQKIVWIFWFLASLHSPFRLSSFRPHVKFFCRHLPTSYRFAKNKYLFRNPSNDFQLHVSRF